MNNCITTNFGKILKYIRKRKKLTQNDLANSLGINLRQIARIEAGESFVSAETLYQLCLILEIKPSVLFDFNVDDTTENINKPQDINIDDIVADFKKQIHSRLNKIINL